MAARRGDGGCLHRVGACTVRDGGADATGCFHEAELVVQPHEVLAGRGGEPDAGRQPAMQEANVHAFLGDRADEIDLLARDDCQQVLEIARMIRGRRAGDEAGGNAVGSAGQVAPHRFGDENPATRGVEAACKVERLRKPAQRQQDSCHAGVTRTMI